MGSSYAGSETVLGTGGPFGAVRLTGGRQHALMVVVTTSGQVRIG